MKNNKGITMISLVITIIVLLIVTSITIYNGLGQLGIKRVNNLYADIDSISTKVAEYYLKNETLPVLDYKYVNDKQELQNIFRQNGATENDNLINVNDGNDYYVIDLSKLDNLTLNYGDDYKDWTSTSSADDIQNIYIINSVTHQIYFPHGVRFGNDYYFARFPDENVVSPIELEDIEANWTMEITNIIGNNIDENNSSIVADVSLSGLNTNYDLNSLEYAWSETDIESQLENTDFTRFNVNIIDEDNLTATLSSKALSNTAENYFLWVKVVNSNGKTSYKHLTNSASPITGKLPSNYQRVEYIESTEEQYIDTGLILNENSGYYIDFVPENDVTDIQASHYINAGGAGGGKIYTRVGINAYVEKNKTGTGELQFYNLKKDPKITKNVRTQMSIINKTIIYGDGSTSEGTSDQASLNGYKNKKTSNSLIIFAAHNEPIERYSKMKLYSLKLYNSNDVIRNFIPCYRKSDNKPGLYDLVTGEFYVNQGTGDDFNVGPITDLPSEYQKVEYIESTGTQWINTGYIPKTNTELRLEISFSGAFQPKDNGGAAIFASKSNDGEQVFTINFGGQSNQYNQLYPWINKSYGKGAEIQLFNINDSIKNNRNLIIMKSGSVSYGTVSRDLVVKEEDNEDPLLLLGCPTTITEIVPFSAYDARVYSLQLLDNDLKRDFIPCKRKSDNKPGLFDLVGRKFYTNQGTGNDFNVGNNVE